MKKEEREGKFREEETQPLNASSATAQRIFTCGGLLLVEEELAVEARGQPDRRARARDLPEKCPQTSLLCKSWSCAPQGRAF